MSRKKTLADLDDEYFKLLFPDSLSQRLPQLSQMELLIHLQQIDRELYDFRRGLRILDQNILQARNRLLKLRFKRARVLQIQRKLKKKLSSLQSRIREVRHLLEDPSQQDPALWIAKLNTLKAHKLKFKEALHPIEERRIRLRERFRKVKDLLKTWQEDRKKMRRMFKERQGGLEAQRAALQKFVDASVMRSYEKLLQRYDGQAVVRVTEGVCQGCHTMIPSCVVSSLIGKRIVVCEVCQRFLYFIATPLEPIIDLNELAVEEPRRVRFHAP
jgi:predicted  nucleic acid-binding Zn-ribbon protein